MRLHMDILHLCRPQRHVNVIVLQYEAHYNDGCFLLFQGRFDKLGASYGFVSI